MNQQDYPENNPPFTPQPSIWQQADSSTIGGGIQATIGDGNVQIQGDGNQVVVNLQHNQDKSSREVVDKVEKIFDEYTQLFVGREKEIQKLDNFLSDNSSGVILVTAGAGFGKTSLLANWVNLQQDKNCFIAYHFFSERGDGITRSIANAYRNLLRQLYSYYELNCQHFANDENQLRDTLYSLVKDKGAKDDKPLVIVLDALDEAEHPFSPPFPNPLPKNVFIIASARAEEGEEPKYLENWTDNSLQLHLERLSKGAIDDWLRQTGEGELAKFADDTHFVSQLDEITEGFPLYLNYLTDDLSHAVKQGQDVWFVLAQTPKGFERYIKQQLKRLDELDEKDLPDERWQFFALLAVAKGVLKKDDVKSLTRMGDRQLRQLHQSWQVTRWLRIGVLKSENKFYAFAHPLLATTFAALLEDDAQEALEKLINYCANWQEHRSFYALRHYAEHLRDVQQWDELYAIARNQDFAATQRQYLPDEPDLPLLTVQTALLGAADRDDTAVIAELLLLHAQQLEQTTTQNSPLDALRTGNLNLAIALADLYEIERCALWYLLLAWELKDTGKLDEALKTLEKLQQKKLVCGFSARAGTYGIRSSYADYAAYILAYVSDISKDAFVDITQRLLYQSQQLLVCQTLSVRRHFKIALEIARSMEDEWWKLKSLADIAIAQAQDGDKTAAQNTLIFILQTAQPTDEKYEWIAIVHAKAGNFDVALETAWKIENKEKLVRALGEIAIAQVQVGQQEVARANLTLALNLARQIEVVDKSDSQRAHVLQGVAIALAEAGFADDALKTAKESGWECTQGEVLKSIAKILAHSGNFDSALKIAGQMVVENPNDSFAQSRALEPIAETFAEHGNLDAALNVVSKMVYNKPEVIGSIAAKMAKIGAAKVARDLFAGVLKTTTYFKEPQQKQAEALGAIAQVQAKLGQRNEARATFTTAIEVAQKINDKGSRDWALQTIAETQLESEELTVALKTAQMIVNDEGRLLTILPVIAIAHGLAGDKDTARKIFTYALEKARKLDNEPSKEAILRDIAKGQAQIGDFDTALETAQENGRDFTLPQVLGVIALVQVRDGKIEAARATFAIAVEEALHIGKSWERSWTLQTIAEVQAQTYTEEFLNVALNTASQIDTQMHKATAVLEIAKVKMRLSQFAAALKTVQQIQIEGEQAVEVMTIVAEAKAKVDGTEVAQIAYAKALKLVREIKDDGVEAKLLETLAKSQAKSGFGFQAISTSEKILINRNQHFPNIAKVLAEVGDKENFKRLLIKSAYYLDAAYEMCGSLAHLYPEQAAAIAKVVS